MDNQNRIGKHATTVTDREDVVTVKYHKTVVFTWNKIHDRVRLNSGGWKTVSTKTRMNQAANQFGLPFRVYQSKGDWFVGFNLAAEHVRKALPFEDGMMFNPFWSPDNAE